MNTVWALFDKYTDADMLMRRLNHQNFTEGELAVAAPGAVARDHVGQEDEPAAESSPLAPENILRSDANSSPPGLDNLLVNRPEIPSADAGSLVLAGSLARQAIMWTAKGHAGDFSLFQALLETGLPENQARPMAEGVRRGKVLFGVHGVAGTVAQVSDMMREQRAERLELAERTRMV